MLKFKRIQPSNEIPSIEMLRGIASLMVCIFHLVDLPAMIPPGNFMAQIGKWGFAGVQIFFLISGFIIPYSMYAKKYTIGDFPVFLKKRIIRIEPPYLISIVLVIFLNYISTLSPFYRGAPFSVDWYNVAAHFAYLNIFIGKPWLNPVYWTLAVEFQYYILIALAFSLVTSKKVVYRVLFFICFAASSFLELPVRSFIFTYAGYFLAGILLFQLVCKIISLKEFWLMITVLVVFLWFKEGAFLASLTVITLLVINYVNVVPPFLRYLGMISYSLYLLHVPIGGRIMNIVEMKTHNQYIGDCAVVVACFFSIFAAAIYYRFVEKFFKKLSAKIKYHKPVIGNFKKTLSESPL
jgi:peptidoglycan/LPS O-acetylase OafA/YrhL